MKHLANVLLVFAACVGLACTHTENDILSEEQQVALDGGVEKGLAWLAGRQQPDGSFPTMPHGQPAVTSLCVMAFLAHGHLPGEGLYGETLQRALNFTIRCQKPSGLVALVAPGGTELVRAVDHEIGNTAVYNHAISALMVSEAYAMSGGSQAEALSQAVEQALKVTSIMQEYPTGRSVDKGGWRYLDIHNDGIESDPSVTSWQLMFLPSAKNSGFDVPEEPISAAVSYVENCFSNNYGTIGYTTQGRALSRGMSGAGILALAHAGKHNSRQATAAGDWLLRYSFDEYNREVQFGQGIESKDRYHYALFHCCQGMYQLGGRYWAEFFPGTAQTLIDHQQSDGSWPADSRGSDAPFGNSYTTSLVLLSLDAPNQLLPIFQR